MNVYLDSSVVLRRLLAQPRAVRKWSEWEVTLTSGLMRIEVMRTLDRLRVTGKMDDLEIADFVELLRLLSSGLLQIPLQPPIMERAAAPFPTSVGTLDALHLATALLWTEETGKTLTFLTHDRELAIAARACGFETPILP